MIDRLRRPDIADRTIPGKWDGEPTYRRWRGQRAGNPGRGHHRLPDSGWPCPLGRKADQAREVLTRRIQSLPESNADTNMGPGIDNGQPPALYPQHRRGRVLCTLPQSLGARSQQQHQPGYQQLPTQRTHHQTPTANRQPPTANPTLTPSPTN